MEAAVLSAAKGTFKAGSYIGTLKNNGTQLEYGGVSVPASLKAKISRGQGRHHRRHDLGQPEQLPGDAELKSTSLAATKTRGLLPGLCRGIR